MKVLVTAASRHGSTAEIASRIGQHLADAGWDVDVRTPEDVGDLDGVDAVVLGSAVYAGRWLKAAYDLVERLGPELRARPVWLFSSGPLGDPPVPAEETDVSDVAQTAGARGHQVFAGALDKHKLVFAERAIARALHAPLGDFRDWDAIERWAGQISSALGAHPST
ncbi:flavodoxin domain-containing protein [Georgenia sp. SYP-B2076]|uniref:flavodoxin domain-containing protein n=1 Tax=Georgenia sp. SYP-B2076 TaxID=2495881 RepID=UPI000F8DF180|nr:flavodoxin domain-containing protein [Georgenia sp. SYP-B2076]